MKIKYLEDLQIAPCLEKGSPHPDDLVLYTCTPGGASRVMIACDRAET